ncbi:hypothetical protein BFP97_08385 [Roseivirga sp. 4D4]|nr:hypothetical protein BFP97_08385 [Roseivirga sp. 4D4]
MDKKNKHIDRLTPEVIEAYHTGKLSPEQMHQVEVLMLENPLYAEGMEGIESLGLADLSADLNELTARLDQATDSKVAPFWTLYRRVAAIALLLITSVGLFYLLDDQPPLPTQDLSEAKKPDIELPEDSVSNETDNNQAGQQSKKEPEIVKEGEPDLSESDETLEPEIVTQPSPLRGKVAGIKAESTQEITIPMTSFERSVDSMLKRSTDIDTSPELSLQSKRKQNSQTSRALRNTAFEANQGTVRSLTIRGEVLTADDGFPLPFVSVFKKGTTTGTPTDTKGQFVINDINIKDTLVFRFLGYQTREVPITGDSILNVTLEPDFTSLGEVVITGVAAATPEKKLAFSISKVETGDLSLISDDPNMDLSSYASAKPEGGFTSFNRYLRRNLKYPEAAKEQKIRGRVTLEFDVSAIGELSNFKIIKGLGYGCDEEAIRLVKDGPKWNPRTEGVDKRPVSSTVKIRVRFRP